MHTARWHAASWRTLLGPADTSIGDASHVEQASDGLPVLRLGRALANDEVIDAIGRERSER